MNNDISSIVSGLSISATDSIFLSLTFASQPILLLELLPLCLNDKNLNVNYSAALTDDLQDYTHQLKCLFKAL